jgi:hypothetical protein
MLKKRDKLFNGQTCLADDCAQRAAVEFFVIGDGGLSCEPERSDCPVVDKLQSQSCQLP